MLLWAGDSRSAEPITRAPRFTSRVLRSGCPTTNSGPGGRIAVQLHPRPRAGEQPLQQRAKGHDVGRVAAGARPHLPVGPHQHRPAGHALHQRAQYLLVRAGRQHRAHEQPVGFGELAEHLGRIGLQQLGKLQPDGGKRHGGRNLHQRQPVAPARRGQRGRHLVVVRRQAKPQGADLGPGQPLHVGVNGIRRPAVAQQRKARGQDKLAIHQIRRRVRQLARLHPAQARLQIGVVQNGQLIRELRQELGQGDGAEPGFDFLIGQGQCPDPAALGFQRPWVYTRCSLGAIRLMISSPWLLMAAPQSSALAAPAVRIAK